ncbi:MAG TPA: glycosyltransferase [Opitutaceae bacterium]|nr:glycosyltransferase [Opitutaceae bacterium]
MNPASPDASAAVLPRLPADLVPPRPEERLRVTQISTTDVRGGAARAASRLHRALAWVGVSSRMVVAQQFEKHAETDVVELNAAAPAPAIVGQVLFRLGRRWHRPPVRQAGAFFTPDWSVTGWRLLGQLPASDIVNLHWVADLLDYRTLPRLAARQPLVWTFHDMNVFTGGCHYSGPCNRYCEGCGACPQLMTSCGERDMTRRVLLRKSHAFAAVPPERLTVVCPSEWLAAEARRSRLCRRFDVRVIPNGIDVAEYLPIERAEARRRVDVPQTAKVVLFVADSVADERKGLESLLAALDALRAWPDLLLVTLGRGGAKLPLTIPHRHLGEVHDPTQLRAAYSAADAFAIPTRQDNLPNTILESMACGTPVIGFRTGGVGEAVIDGITGLLAPSGDAGALATALRRMIGNPDLRRSCGAEARRHAERNFSVELQARRYASLYEELRARDRRSPPRRRR